MLAREIISIVEDHLRLTKLQSELRVNGVNKTYYMKADGWEAYLRLSPNTLHPDTDLSQEYTLIKYINAHDPCICVKVLLEPFPAELNEGAYTGLLTSVATGAGFTGQVSEIQSFAAALASLHSIDAHQPWPPPAERKRREEGIKDSTGGKLGAAIELLESATSCSDVHPIPLTAVICHGDAWPGNANYGPQSATLFDLEHSHMGAREFDLATMAWWLMGQHDKESAASLWEVFLRTYARGNGVAVAFDLLPNCILQNELRSLRFMDGWIVLPDSAYADVISRAETLVDDWQENGPSADQMRSDGTLRK
jgi:aminoglycoside phosphotransferase (APT) family kinase protein